jgi:predicted RND superfamily exporter protein
MYDDLRRSIQLILDTIPQRAGLVIAAIALLSAGSVLLIFDPSSGQSRIDLDPSASGMVPADDPGRIYWDHVQATFADGEPLLLALAGENVFTPDSLRRIQRITERIEELDSIHHVSSLARAVNIHSSEGELRVSPFYDEVPTSPEALADLERRALEDPIYAGNLVSRDASIATIVVYSLDISERELVASGFAETVVAIAEEERGSAALWATGVPHVRAATARLLMRDMTRVIPATWVVMAFIAFLAFRSLRGVFIPILTVQISQLWALSLIGSLYGQLNMVTMAAPPVLVVVGLAYSIHVLSAYLDRIRALGDTPSTPREVTAHVLHEVSSPIFFTGLTTAVGFFSLVLSPLDVVRQFGVFCGVGVMLTALASLTLAPAILALLPLAKLPKRMRTQGDDDFISRWLARTARFNTRNGRAILLAAGLVAVLGAAGATRIELGTDLISNLRESNPVRQDFVRINENLEGANSLSVVFEANERDAFKEPENLRILADTQAWLAQQPEIGGSTSLADYVKLLNRNFDSAGAFDIPASRELVSQLLVVGANEDIEQFIDSDFQLARIRVRSNVMDSDDVMTLVNRLEAHLAALPTDLRSEVTGLTVLVSRTQDLLALGQALSICAAFILIYAVLAMLFRSLWIGAIALVPNALPVIAYFGLLGWTGVQLNSTTAIVACLVIGIAVDDTIHYLAHFRQAARRLASETEGAEEALRAVGRPITITSFALSMGFVTMMLSEINGTSQLGWLASLTLAIAWVVDVTLTPTLAARMRIVTTWDVLVKDFDREPHEWLPILQGMSEAQGRLALALGQIEEFPAQHVLIQEGDVNADEFYTVIAGRLSTTVTRDGEQTQLRPLGPGEVIGEIGMVRGRRTATVRAESEVRVLRFSQRDIDRLAKRHPRISNKIHKNLIAGLAERLDSLSSRVA